VRMRIVVPARAELAIGLFVRTIAGPSASVAGTISPFCREHRSRMRARPSFRSDRASARVAVSRGPVHRIVISTENVARML